MSDIQKTYKFYNAEYNMGAEVYMSPVDNDAIVIKCAGEYKGYLILHRSLLPDVVECILTINQGVKSNEKEI